MADQNKKTIPMSHTSIASIVQLCCIFPYLHVSSFLRDPFVSWGKWGPRFDL